MAAPMVVDRVDRRTAAMYAAIIGGLFAPAAVIVTHPRLAGPLPWWQVIAAAAAGAGLNSILPLRRDQEGRREYVTAAVFAGFWLAPGGWLAWAQCHDVFHHAGRYWLTGALLTVLCVVAAYQFAMPTSLGLPLRGDTPAPGTPAAGPPAEPADELGDLIAKVSRGKIVGTRTAAVDHWDTGCGYTARLDVPPDGTTWETLQPYQGAIAAALDLGKGTVVTVLPDDERGHRGVLLKVLTTDAMAGDMNYPGLDDDGLVDQWAEYGEG
jgi:hypothetical protein